MKISIIHNTYRLNPYIRESVILNLKALDDAGINYQYIVFNDNGDTNIKREVEDLNVLYHYSDHNFGHKMCSGGWVGALPLVTGDLIHNTGQDDIFTSFFYRRIIDMFKNTGCDLVYCNGFTVKEDLSITGNLLGPLQNVDYSNPRSVFNQWFGITNGVITRTNNFIPAPGTIYKRSLHDELDIPDLNNFRGAADFEYWSRVLFYKKIVKYINIPCWLYRVSSYSHSQDRNVHQNYETDIKFYLDKIKHKYQQLLEFENGHA